MFRALHRRFETLRQGVERMRLAERIRSTRWRMPERWVDADTGRVVYETPRDELPSTHLQGVGPVIHPKEYLITDEWDPSMEGTELEPTPVPEEGAFSEWGEGLPGSSHDPGLE